MFNTESNSVEPEVVVCDVCRTIPISHLSFDAAEPIGGWLSFFAERGVEVVTDDLGRSAVRREILGQLLTERREREARLAAEQARKMESLKPEPVGAGVPALSDDASPFESLMNGDRSYVSPAEEFGQRPKPNFLAEKLEAGQRKQLAERAAIKEQKKEK